MPKFKYTFSFHRIKSFFTCVDLFEIYENMQYVNEQLHKRRQIYRLILDFSFLPQIIAVTVLYMDIKGESAVLLDNFTSALYLAVFLQIFAFSFFTAVKRFYFIRIFPAFAYLELVVAGIISGYVNAWLRFFLFAFFGLIICFINVCALYGWKNVIIFKTIDLKEEFSSGEEEFSSDEKEQPMDNDNDND